MSTPRFRGYNLWQAALLIGGASLSVSLWLFQSAHAGGLVLAYIVSGLTLLFAYAVDSTAVDTLIEKYKSLEMETWRRVVLVCLLILFSPLLFAAYCGGVWYQVVRPFFTQPTTYRRTGMCIAAFALPLLMLGTPMTFAAGGSSTPTRTANVVAATPTQQATPTATVDPAVATASAISAEATATALSQPTPTPIPPTPTPLPTMPPATGNPPQVGGTLADFIAQYGQPFHPAPTSTLFYVDSTQNNSIGVVVKNGIVTKVDYNGDTSWDDIQTFNACSPYLPSDAALYNNDSNQYYDYHSSLGMVVLMNLGSGVCSVYVAGA